ncbi:DUF2255 family protein [Streptomyces sp. NPDC020898]|uniref:DUF2255 family protein n=1 Tax=Streptomyces sp. NPDC020898 TaxID=3365101 RepID=UPI0037B51DAB
MSLGSASSLLDELAGWQGGLCQGVVFRGVTGPLILRRRLLRRGLCHTPARGSPEQCRQGRVSAGGVRKDVTFQDADPGDWSGVDAAYRRKYGSYKGIVDHVLTEKSRESTTRLVPR